MNAEFSAKEITLIKKAREDVFGALIKIRDLDFSCEGGVASIQAILLLGVIDDLLTSNN